MADTQEFFETYKNLQEEEFNMIKHFINYDGLVDNLIREKETKMLEYKIKINQMKMAILTYENDIKRVKEEQKNSNHKLPHIFINPNMIYHKITQKE